MKDAGRLDGFFGGEARQLRLHIQDMTVLISMAGDFIVFLLGMRLAFCLRFHSPVAEWLPPFSLEQGAYGRFILFGPALFSILAMLGGTYRQDRRIDLPWVYWHIVRPMFFWAVTFVLLTFLFHVEPSISRAYIALSVLVCGGFLTGWHLLLEKLFAMAPIREQLRQRILVIGWNQEAEHLQRVLQADSSARYQIAGCLPSAHSRYKVEPPASVARLGDYNEVEEIVGVRSIDIVLVADLDPNTREMIALSELCARQMIQFKVIPSFFQILLSGLKLERIGMVPVLGVTRLTINSMLNRVLKRTLDIAGALVGLLLAAPIVAFCGLLVYWESPGPVLYAQVRAGRGGRLFSIYKIRSMKLNAEVAGAGWTTKDDPRRLRIGAFLRKYNLDEVPQFWNVLKGEMSLVGPRPERPEWIEKFKGEIQFYNARHYIKPGMTGWAQVHGLRGDNDLRERLRYDLYYIENWTLLLDVYLLFMTFFRVKNAY
ncbi:MAG: exopolysaccharide biosynthesis polyprenyl glycosylphosphotransferase [Verrucomicrobium sp.]|nr:exopolysaccharide biosynthesis polyprenyl glycosylphosphotransferase [Verrucomicrobium sp.]